MGHSSLNEEQVVATPCNLVGMLRVGVRRDVPNFSGVRVQEEELCQSVAWMTITAIMPFRLVLSKDNNFRLNLHVERRKMTKRNRSVAQRVLNVKVEADALMSPKISRVGDTSIMVHRYDRGATSRSASARCVLRGFVSETE
eukprot:3294016-Pleurochrysis_carterae.AAC.5